MKYDFDHWNKTEMTREEALAWFESGFEVTDGKRCSPTCPQCQAEEWAIKALKTMDPRKDYRQAIESVLWYNELWPIVQKWKDLPVVHGHITAPPVYGCPNPEEKTWTYTYFQLQIIWMIAVELFGDCGTSPRSGCITDVDGFRKWITDLTHESALYASERENKEKNRMKYDYAYESTKNEPELSVGRCNGKTIHRSAWIFEQAIRESIKGKKPDGEFSCIEIRIPDYALIDRADEDEFVGCVINELKRHISGKVSDILSTDDEYIMSLSPSRVVINPMDCTQTVGIRLKHKELIRCRDCAYCKRGELTGKLMCNHPSFVHHIDSLDGYCHNGKKPDLTDYFLKEEPDEQEGKK